MKKIYISLEENRDGVHPGKEGEVEVLPEVAHGDTSGSFNLIAWN